MTYKQHRWRRRALRNVRHLGIAAILYTSTAILIWYVIVIPLLG